jgi:hypothetical protein
MSAAAAAGAAAMIRRKRDEEESMTGYSPSDLAQDWEFKILRSCTSAFRNPQRLQQVIEEESRAGWVLIEKFDDQRLRFKRPASARSGDSTLEPGCDPYRTTFGISDTRLALTIVTIILVTLAFIIGIVLAIKNTGTP